MHGSLGGIHLSCILHGDLLELQVFIFFMLITLILHVYLYNIFESISVCMLNSKFVHISGPHTSPPMSPCQGTLEICLEFTFLSHYYFNCWLFRQNALGRWATLPSAARRVARPPINLSWNFYTWYWSHPAIPLFCFYVVFVRTHCST